MHLSSDARRVLTLVLALSVVTATAGFGLFVMSPSVIAATGNPDDESTSTSTTSDIISNTTISDFNASENASYFIEASFDGNLSGDAAMAFVDPETADKKDDMAAVYTNTSGDVTNESANHYAWNVSGDELDEVPIEANENKTFYLKIWDTKDKDNATYTKFYLNATGERTVLEIADYNTGDDEAAVIDERGWSIAGFGSTENQTTYEEEDVNIGDENTTLTINLDNESAANSADTAYEGLDSGDWSDQMIFSLTNEDGDTVYIPVFSESQADSEWDLVGDGVAYGVYDADANQLTVELNGDDEFENASATDVTVESNYDMSLSNQASMFKSLGSDDPWIDAFVK